MTTESTETFECLKAFPYVQKLIAKNSKLKRQKKELKQLLKLLTMNLKYIVPEMEDVVKKSENIKKENISENVKMEVIENNCIECGENMGSCSKYQQLCGKTLCLNMGFIETDDDDVEILDIIKEKVVIELDEEEEGRFVKCDKCDITFFCIVNICSPRY